ncbi:MAG: 16S rRNA (cytosine(967)-C(5))-methyltransferase RsmB [Ruminococcus sp.]|nr:16S rRNA (cytosine(967)-C(5))-methyltransferase RsmB [Ruminococcus sp.]
MADPRYVAVKLLDKTLSSGSYSNLQLDAGLKNSDLSPQDKRFCTALYYGVIERKITLDHILSGLSSRSLSKLDSIIITILRCGIYQILYMENIPDNAAVNESVKLAKKFGKTSASGMVNAVLRNFIRSGKDVKLPEGENKALSVKYSAPESLVESLISDYGTELAENLLSDSFGQPPVYIRLNSIEYSGNDDFITKMMKGCTLTDPKILPYCRIAEGDPTGTPAFTMGLFHVQDLASQLCCEALAPAENDTVLDLCAAPGGKTFTMAEMMNGKGRIYAFDLHEKRVGLIRSGAETLGLDNITARQGDAAVFDTDMPKAEKILCDVPCSGIGVIRKKPEIKYKDISEFKRLPEIQYKIAENALNYLADGGEMVYSTCTLRKAENEEVVKRLLEAHPEIELAELPQPLGSVFSGGMASIFPKHFGSDGFFIAKLHKIQQ